ncbi:MAG: hypothetical protein K2X66_07955 [Cyanobacteria bacterium]|nr:hypothetical protein [Cyanobacteriota bacterium]
MANKIGLCHFCNEEKKLAKSHIIPEYFYRELRQEEPHLLMVSSESTYLKRSPIGEYDQILCQDCENHFNHKWDDYGIKFFQQANDWPLKHADDVNKTKNFYEIIEYDYAKLKLFFLSILWRAHVSQRSNWKAIQLGSDAPRIISLLRLNSPGSIEEFPIVLFKLTMHDKGHNFHKLMQSPFIQKTLEGNSFYSFQLNEFVFWIKEDNQQLQYPYTEFFLREYPPLIIAEREFEDSGEEKRMKETIQRHVMHSKVVKH